MEEKVTLAVRIITIIAHFFNACVHLLKDKDKKSDKDISACPKISAPVEDDKSVDVEVQHD